MDSEIRAEFANLSELVERNGESLQNEMRALETETRTGMDRVEAATRRNTTALTSGALAIARLQRWARLQKLERSLKRRAS